MGLARDEIRALAAAADADRGRQALRTAAVIRMLLHNGVVRVTRKGARKAKVPLTPATAAALDAHLADRAELAGLSAHAGR